ncbi:MAG: Stp1/IreP family PP2C-type Ser/Thr phosphatase [Clostridiales Family XIII bacterium]|nr:Stp1/IreP family PP2C-type Ser/Thr phosphatase [Clostridiales Family XIII bacterium]
MARAGFRTDRGRFRGNNEDALLVLPKFQIYVVADGVGGRNSGEIASRKAVNGIEKYVRSHPVDAVHDSGQADAGLMEYFLRCLREINAEILAVSAAEPSNAGMATTAVLAHVFENRLYVVNVGDSRAYMVRNGGISQITVDHTTVNRLVYTGELTEEEARVHPRKNEITRALGAESEILPDFFVTEIRQGDRILLCTDGLHGELGDDEICGIVAGNPDLNEACKNLVDRANAKGGKDNITVICLEV